MTTYSVEESAHPFYYHSVVKIGNYFFAFYNSPSTSYDKIYYETSANLQTWSNKTLVLEDASVGYDVIYWKNKIWILYSKTDTIFYIMGGTVSGTSISWDSPVAIWDANTGRMATMTASKDESLLYIITRSYLPYPNNYTFKVFKSSNGTSWTEILNQPNTGVDYAMSIEICQHPSDDDGCMILIDYRVGSVGGYSCPYRLYDGSSWGDWGAFGVGYANYSWQRAKRFGSEIILIWGPAIESNFDIYLRKYSGGVWTTEFIIENAAYSRFGIFVGCNEENIYIVYKVYPSFKTYIRAYNGSTWTDPEEMETLTDDTLYISTLRESSDMDNDIPIVYRENSGNPYEVRVFRYETSETLPYECPIKLDNICYDHIIDTLFAESKIVHLPEWVDDSSPDVDSNIWTRKVGTIIYVLRITDAEKWVLDQVLTGHTLVILRDTTYGLDDINVWLRVVEAEWEGNVNWADPWKITLELITERITRT